ncbi:hypothetical protein [Synechococcus sp. PCC 6312]|uniref:hypothetical protein n=1 Tax=Synechococcus sp. (strain ATCC 27167 / PCC 6312) TaxID=195253 RepID=UPI00029EEB54|nr:hypothetical protein [Synechococcus sp. PCC 6312]AFY61942.1 hypothetical protein Syn6312_2878 [Synechococcus sp. PCC 6312]
MSINLSALTIRPTSQKEREEKAAYRKWQGVFYTLRFLVWDNGKSQIIADALADGSIERTEDGFDPDDIKELYANAWKEFSDSFDKAFIKATVEEMVEFSQKHFGMGLDQLLDLNRQRSAERYNR